MAREISEFKDKITIKEIELELIVGLDKFKLNKPQRILLNLTLILNLSQISKIDTLISKKDNPQQESVNYSEVTKHVITFLTKIHEFSNLKSLAQQLIKDLKDRFRYCNVKSWIIDLCIPNAFLSGISLHYTIDSTKQISDWWKLENINVETIIGINECERLIKQSIIFSLSVKTSLEQFHQLIHKLKLFVAQSQYKTIESLVDAVCRLILFDEQSFVIEVNVELIKLYAIKNGIPSVKFNRKREDYLNKKMVTNESKDKNNKINRCVIGIGTNLGNRFDNITHALKFISGLDCRIINSSKLYKSQSEGFTNEPEYYNCCIEISTTLDPFQILKRLQSIEIQMGKTNGIKYGNRVIDLDVLFFNKECIFTPELIVPHPRIQERIFVLQPLMDFIPSYIHPKLNKSIKELYLKDKFIVPILNINNKEIEFNKDIILIGILNCTHNSFSDGGKYLDVDLAIKHFEDMITKGANWIDIGACSSRPGSQPISKQAEMKRVQALINKIDNEECIISIDTLHEDIIQAALSKAHVWNCIEPDHQRLLFAARLGCPIILMHNLAVPEDVDFLSRIIIDVENLIESAIQSGIYRFNIIIDLGFGFKKTREQNFILLKNLRYLINYFGMPMLVALSKKKFLTDYCSKGVNELQSWSTAAAISASVFSGARLFRVHDVKEIKEVIDVTKHLI